MDQTIQLATQVIEAGTPQYFVTANLNYLMLTRQFPRLHEVNNRAAAVLADGYPIVLRSVWTQSPLPSRVAGADLIVELARLSEQKGFRIFFLGGAPGVAELAADKLREKFPGMQIAGCYAPPFRTLSSAEHEQQLTKIREARTDILLVAFGQPKGEFWIDDNLGSCGVPLSIQLGASFDFLAGTARRAPLWIQKVGFEWLYRACGDPRRLGPRYLRNAIFLVQQIVIDIFRPGSRLDSQQEETR